VVGASAAALSNSVATGVLVTTIRISLTPEPGGDRTLESRWLELLQTMGFRVFVPLVARVRMRADDLDQFQELARTFGGFIPASMPQWKRRLSRGRGAQRPPSWAASSRAGRSKHSDIAFRSLGTASNRLRRFSSRQKVATLRGATVAADFKQM